MTKVLLAAALAWPCIAVAQEAPAKVQDGVLVGPNGMTLYTFLRDGANSSRCAQKCAELWPPFKAAAGGTSGGDWTLVSRDDGSKQWAYKSKPLYYWVKDKKPGDRTGDKVGDTWHVARP
jgi:predicted lipoprotein with Yx(FWY)xxD motif